MVAQRLARRLARRLATARRTTLRAMAPVSFALACLASACTVAVDYDRCESATIPAEVSGVCPAGVAPCVNDCFLAGGTNDELGECIQGCTGVGPCRDCFFAEPTWCAVRNECGDLYDDYLCCVVGRCGSLDDECPVCFSEASAFGACVDESLMSGMCMNVYNNCFMR